MPLGRVDDGAQLLDAALEHHETGEPLHAAGRGDVGPVSGDLALLLERGVELLRVHEDLERLLLATRHGVTPADVESGVG